MPGGHADCCEHPETPALVNIKTDRRQTPLSISTKILMPAHCHRLRQLPVLPKWSTPSARPHPKILQSQRLFSKRHYPHLKQKILHQIDLSRIFIKSNAILRRFFCVHLIYLCNKLVFYSIRAARILIISVALDNGLALTTVPRHP